MADGNSLFNLASLLLKNVDVNSILKTVMGNGGMGQLGGMLQGILGGGKPQAPQGVGSPPQPVQAVPQGPPNQAISPPGPQYSGFNISSAYRPPISFMGPQAMQMPGMFSQFLPMGPAVQGYSTQPGINQNYMNGMDLNYMAQFQSPLIGNNNSFDIFGGYDAPSSNDTY